MAKLRTNCLLRGRCYRIIYVMLASPTRVLRSRPSRAVKKRTEAALRLRPSVCDATHCPCVMPDLRLLQSLPCQALLKITKI